MMDMKYLDRVVGRAIEDFVRGASKRNNANIGAGREPPCARGPACNVGNDTSDAPLDGQRDGRMVEHEPIGDCGEVVEGFVGIDDLHRVRNLAKACKRGVAACV